MNSNSLLYRLFRWPLKAFNTRTRLAFSLSLSALSIILLAQVFGILPDHNQQVMEGRKLQAETLAMTGSAIAESRDLRSFKQTLANTVDRAEDLLSVGLRRTDGDLTVSIGDHATLWQQPASGKSNDRFMFVPIFRGTEEVAQLEMCYRPLSGVVSWLQSPAVTLGAFMFLGGFLAFSLVLHRPINQLDPRGAVPHRVRDAFDHMAEGLLILDRSCKIMLANGKFGALVGLDAGRLTGMNASDFPWDCEEDLPWVRAIREHTPVTEAAVEIVAADKGLRTFRVSAAPILGSGRTSRGVMVTFDDITSLEMHKRDLIEARNEADAANEAKSNFLSRMSHEIRTPMNAIIGYTDILQEGALDRDDQVRYLTTIQSSGEHLLALINDILDLSKVEAGQMTIERREIPLVALMRDVVDTLSMKASEKNLLLSMEVDGQVPQMVETDDTRLKQVLINTIGNAIKFTQQGGVRLVSRMTADPQKPMLQFDVIDTGIGMSAGALQSIFDPFTQADDSVTRKFGGTGLGLAISKQLSEALGGGISVASEEGKGTTFTITIDPGLVATDATWITNENLAAERRTTRTADKPQKRIMTGHVLVVDDATANRELAGLMLKRLGVTCDLAEHGKEALERLVETRYDAVLMDVNMPVMDGMTATRMIREAGLKLPVIAVTAIALEHEKQNCLDAGYDRILIKPIRQESLITALEPFFDFEVVERATTASAPAPTTTETESADSTSSASQPAPIIEIDDDLNDTLNEILGDAAAAVKSEGADAAKPADARAASTTEFTLPDVVETSLPSDPEFMEIVLEFVQRLSERLPEFDAALATDSTIQLNDLGHWLAGAAGTVGLDDLVAPSRELEHTSDDDRERQVVLVKRIQQLHDRIRLPTTVE